MIDTLQTARPLSAYLEVLEAQGIVVGSRVPDATVTVTGATDDSRRAQAGGLFVCKGAAFKRDYLMGALAAGAVAYVSEIDYGVKDEYPDVARIIVSDIRRALAVLADAAYDHPSSRVRVCAFTGTKGKTTSVYYLRGILDAAARRAGEAPCAFLTGVEFDTGLEQGPSHLTTPESFELERRCAQAVAAWRRYLVMEASSQALKYDRTYGLDVAVGVFTNFGEDHISPIEHPTIEDYLASKLKLLGQSRVAVVDLDMDVADEALSAARGCERVLTYALENPRADLYASEMHPTDAGMFVRVVTPAAPQGMALTVPTPVRFNVSNALGAIAVAVALGVDEESIAEGIAGVRVPGRMELYPSEDGQILGVVDYAHNGMSLETMLRDLRANYPEREIAVVFGATGGKGVDRRETMGVAAGALADRIVITEDDPGPEDVAAICDAIAAAVSSQGNGNWQIVLDRERAIRTLVRETKRPAVVIVTGKGCETAMKRAGGDEPYEGDASILARALADRAGGVL